MYSLTLLISCLLATQAAAAEDPALAEQVRALTRQLNAHQQTDRDQAEQEILELGPPALAWLPSIGSPLPPEVKLRLSRIVRKLQTSAVVTASRSTRVTIEGAMSLADALEAIAQQTDNQATASDRYGEMPIVAESNDAEFWPTLDQLLDQTSLTVNPYGGAMNSLRLSARPDEHAPRFGRAVYHDAFRIEPISVSAVQDLRNPEMKGLVLGLEISWEPRITPITISQPLGRLEALDDRGKALVVDRPDGTASGSGRRDISTIRLELPWKLPDREAKRIATLRGTLIALLPGRREAFTFRELETAENVEQHLANATVTLLQMRETSGLHEMRVGVRFGDAANALESHRLWIYDNDAYVVDPDGQRISHIGMETLWQRPDSVGLSYKFSLENGAAEHSFVYETPAMILRKEISYELDDIPLP